MKHILIALDYDPSAENIAEAGYEIAKAMQAKVTLFHAIADAGYYTEIAYSPIMGFNGYVYPGIDEMLVKDLINSSHQFLDQSKAHLGDPNIGIIVKEGELVESILETSEECAVDLIVIGSHTRRGLGKLVNGNIAEALLQKTTIPVLVIPNKAD